MTTELRKKLIPALIVVAVAAAAWYGWTRLQPSGPGDAFVRGNGRIEATEIDVATKLAGRVQSILVSEGDFVTSGQVLGSMQIQSLEAQRDEARAHHQQTVTAVSIAQAQVAVREGDRAASLALVAQRESELDAAQRRLKRSETLSSEGASSQQELDDDRARVRGVQAAVNAAKAQLGAAQAAIEAARAQVVGAQSAVMASQATIARIQVDIADSQFKAPRDGRVQYRIAQPGEVLGGGWWWKSAEFGRSVRRVPDLLPAGGRCWPGSPGHRGAGGAGRCPRLRYPGQDQLRGRHRAVHAQDGGNRQ